MPERRIEKQLDPISASFITTDERYLRAAADDWVTSPDTPEDVAAKLLKARRQFLNADVDYSNFVTSMGTSLQAAELLMRHILDAKPADKRTFGMLVKDARELGILTTGQSEWLDIAVYFRNKLAHGPEFALTPGMADEGMAALHRWVVDMLERKRVRDEAAAEPAAD